MYKMALFVQEVIRTSLELKTLNMYLPAEQEVCLNT